MAPFKNEERTPKDSVERTTRRSEDDARGQDLRSSGTDSGYQSVSSPAALQSLIDGYASSDLPGRSSHPATVQPSRAVQLEETPDGSGHSASRIGTPDGIKEVAAAGLAGSPTTLPFAQQIQASFGSHEISGTRAFVGGEAGAASRQLGARAFATNDAVGFAETPSLRTAAHEAAHVVQQRSGAVPASGVGQAHDHYERHADMVADLVVGGQSAAPLLGGLAKGGGPAAAVQFETGPVAAPPEMAVAIKGAKSRLFSQYNQQEMEKSKIAGFFRNKFDQIIVHHEVLTSVNSAAEYRKLKGDVKKYAGKIGGNHLTKLEQEPSFCAMLLQKGLINGSAQTRAIGLIGSKGADSERDVVMNLLPNLGKSGKIAAFKALASGGKTAYLRAIKPYVMAEDKEISKWAEKAIVALGGEMTAKNQDRIKALEEENSKLKTKNDDLEGRTGKLETRTTTVEEGTKSAQDTATVALGGTITNAMELGKTQHEIAELKKQLEETKLKAAKDSITAEARLRIENQIQVFAQAVIDAIQDTKIDEALPPPPKPKSMFDFVFSIVTSIIGIVLPLTSNLVNLLKFKGKGAAIADILSKAGQNREWLTKIGRSTAGGDMLQSAQIARQVSNKLGDTFDGIDKAVKTADYVKQGVDYVGKVKGVGDLGDKNPRSVKDGLHGDSMRDHIKKTMTKKGAAGGDDPNMFDWKPMSAAIDGTFKPFWSKDIEMKKGLIGPLLETHLLAAGPNYFGNLDPARPLANKSEIAQLIATDMLKGYLLGGITSQFVDKGALKKMDLGSYLAGKFKNMWTQEKAKFKLEAAVQEYRDDPLNNADFDVDEDVAKTFDLGGDDMDAIDFKDITAEDMLRFGKDHNLPAPLTPEILAGLSSIERDQWLQQMRADKGKRLATERIEYKTELRQLEHDKDFLDPKEYQKKKQVLMLRGVQQGHHFGLSGEGLTEDDLTKLEKHHDTRDGGGIGTGNFDLRGDDNADVIKEKQVVDEYKGFKDFQNKARGEAIVESAQEAAKVRAGTFPKKDYIKRVISRHKEGRLDKNSYQLALRQIGIDPESGAGQIEIQEALK